MLTDSSKETIANLLEAFSIQKKREMYEALITAGIICSNSECNSDDCSKSCFN